mmetsp:Transcript_8689/g.12842  ORF Transcript_8689/g.12842 Transcript_8689/m.12842 type:complete len:674 (-) Transcript_8689:39-2060(-)
MNRNNEAIAQYLQRKREEEQRKQREIPMFEVKLTKPLSEISPLLLRSSNVGFKSHDIELKYDIVGDKTIKDRLPQMKNGSELKNDDIHVDFSAKNVTIFLKSSALKDSEHVKDENDSGDDDKENETTKLTLISLEFIFTLAKYGHKWNIEGGILSMKIKKLLPRATESILSNKVPLRIEDEDDSNIEINPSLVVDKANTNIFSEEVSDGLRDYLEKSLIGFKKIRLEFLKTHGEKTEQIAKETFEEQLTYIEKLNEERRKKNETSEDAEEEEIVDEETVDNVDELLESTFQEVNDDENQPTQDEKLKKAEVKMQSTEAPGKNDIYDLYIKSLEETIPEHPTREQLAAIYSEQSTILLANHERKRSVELLDIAAKLGNEHAMVRMAQLYSSTTRQGRMYGVTPNDELSVQYYYNAAFKFSNSSALFYLANMHTKVLKSETTSNVFYAVCVLKGDSTAMFQLANSLYTNSPNDEKVANAQNLWQMSFARGYYKSGITLGNLHTKLYNDMVLGVKYYQIACHMDDKVKFPPHVREYYNNVLLEKELEQNKALESTLNDAFSSVSGKEKSSTQPTTQTKPLLDAETPVTTNVKNVFSDKKPSTTSKKEEKKDKESEKPKKKKSKGRPFWSRLVEWGVQASLITTAMYIGYKFIGGAVEKDTDSGIDTSRMISRDVSL